MASGLLARVVHALQLLVELLSWPAFCDLHKSVCSTSLVLLIDIIFAKLDMMTSVVNNEVVIRLEPDASKDGLLKPDVI